jgi:hypothetical protein
VAFLFVVLFWAPFPSSVPAFFVIAVDMKHLVEILHHRNDKKELHSSRGALRQDQDLSVIQNTKQFLISIKRNYRSFPVRKSPATEK